MASLKIWMSEQASNLSSENHSATNLLKKECRHQLRTIICKDSKIGFCTRLNFIPALFFEKLFFCKMKCYLCSPNLKKK